MWWGESRKSKRRRRFHSTVPGGLSPEDATRMMSGLGNFMQSILPCAQEALRHAGWGWNPDTDISVGVSQGTPLRLLLVGFRRIEVGIEPRLFLQAASDLHSQGLGPNPFAIAEDAIYASVRIYAGYYDVCPLDSWRHLRLIEAARRGAYGLRWLSHREERIAAAIAAFFERSVVSFDLTREEEDDFAKGLVWEFLINRRPSDLLISLFYRVQNLIFPSQWKPIVDSQLVPPHVATDAVVGEVLEILFGVSVRTFRGEMRLRGKPRKPQSWDWPRCVAELAELLVDYIEQESEESQPPQNPFGQPSPSPSGGRGWSSIPTLNPGIPPNPFNSNLDAIGSNNPFTGIEGPPGALSHENSSSPFDRLGGHLPGLQPSTRVVYDNFEEVDRYYSQQLEILEVRDSTAEPSREKEPERLRVGYLGSQRTPVPQALFRRIDWARTRLSAKSDPNPVGLEFSCWEDPLVLPIEGNESGETNFPNLLLAVDSSSSMRFNPSATISEQRGQYDLVLRACWGIFRHIQNSEIASEVFINALNFSSCTRESGWTRCTNLEPVKRTLAQYQGQGTMVDVGVLRRALQSQPGPIVTLFITDGALGNTPLVIESLRGLHDRGKNLVLLHIGNGNAFTNGVQELGGQVHLIQRPTDLVGLCLDVAKDRYRSVKKKGRVKDRARG